MAQTTFPMLTTIGLDVDLSNTSTESQSKDALIYSLENNLEVMKDVAKFGKQYLMHQPLSHIYYVHLTKTFYYYGDEKLYKHVI